MVSTFRVRRSGPRRGFPITEPAATPSFTLTRLDRDPDTQEPYRVTINSRGFRGKEFSDEKKPGVIRVITLGESSTFGLHARDDETYPYDLEHFLNKDCPGRAFECR
jgi:hypothetical protein